MKLKVVAEYVKDAKTLKLLDNLSVGYIQGEIVGMAQPVGMFTQQSPKQFVDRLNTVIEEAATA